MGYHENPPYYLTAYDLAVKWGFRGTEQDWLNSLTAFGIAQQAGYRGTAQDWIETLIDPVPNIQIGEVVTLDGGMMATASFTGDKRNPILNLGIPRGVGMADALPIVGGIMKGNIDMANHFLQNIPAPTEDHHAANKSYVDKRLRKDGKEAMEGNLNLGSHQIENMAAPSEDHHAANKSYVDKRLRKDGFEAMEGNLDMGSFKIRNVAAPTENSDAVPKQYVDEKHFFATVTIKADGWSAEAPYTQTVDVPGMKAEDRPHWGVVLSADRETAIREKEAYAVVDDLDSAENSAVFTCLEEAPTVDLVIQMEVNR